MGLDRHETKHEVFDSVPAAVSKILGDLEIFRVFVRLKEVCLNDNTLCAITFEKIN